jgi:hypothetical protein
MMLQVHLVAQIGKRLASDRIAELQATADQSRRAATMSRDSGRHTPAQPLRVLARPLCVVVAVVVASLGLVSSVGADGLTTSPVPPPGPVLEVYVDLTVVSASWGDVVVRNRGTANAGAFYVTHKDYSTTRRLYVPSLKAGTSVTLHFPYTPYPACNWGGGTGGTARVDVFNQVAEKYETNNVLVWNEVC